MHANPAKPAMPARVKAALEYLEHCRWKTDRDDPSVPARDLSPMERRVERAALHVLCGYFLGEMDYGDAPPTVPPDPDDDDGAPAREPAPA